MKNIQLFDKATIGTVELNNRIVMAPMTRSRANNDSLKPTSLHATYYAQRATAGLIISEGTVVSPNGTGYANVPGIYSQEQIEGWRLTTNAVHEAKGKIFVQLWHVGRLSHPDFLNGALPLAPSAMNPHVELYTPDGKKNSVTPQELSIPQIKSIIEDFVSGAKNALRAGFDGIEIHASNGYLFHQFFNNCSNTRNDEYGGTDENKTRILFELLDRLVLELPKLNIGIRLNPMLHGMLGIIVDKETKQTFDYLIQKLNNYNLSYIHISKPFQVLNEPFFLQDVIPYYRKMYRGFLIANGNYSPKTAQDELEAGNADAIAFARHFIANADLVHKIQHNLQLNQPNPETFYTPGEKGYTDYPTINN